MTGATATATATGAITAARTTLKGRTVVANRVLERIAIHTLSELDRAGGAARRVLGVRLGRDGVDRPPQVQARVDGQVATMRMSIMVAYPAPVRGLARQLRDLIAARVSQLTGVQLRQIDIEIARLVAPGPTARSVQ